MARSWKSWDKSDFSFLLGTKIGSSSIRNPWPSWALVGQPRTAWSFDFCFQWINHSTFQTLKYAKFLHPANFTPANFLCFPLSSTWFTTKITGLPPRKCGGKAQGFWASTKCLLCKAGLTYNKLKNRGLTINKFHLEMERKIPLEAFMSAFLTGLMTLV